MTPQGLNILTHSRMQCSKTCRKKHWFRYPMGWRREQDSVPQRVGSMIHLGIDWLGSGELIDVVVKRLRDRYANIPDWADVLAWMTEAVQVECLVVGYAWRWQSQDVVVLTTEQVFRLPIKNPETGAATPTYEIAGKIDKIVELDDSRKAVREHKTTGDSIDPESDYWKRTRLDHQVTEYYWAARELGYDVTAIQYDVIRKPSIRPKKVPTLDEDGFRIVLDDNGERAYKKNGAARQVGAPKDGFVLQQHTETSSEYGKRLMQDIYSRPDFYYARQEVPRLQADVDEFLQELWDQQKTMREAELKNRHFRNTGACTMFGRCEYLDICHGTVDTANGPPPGFVKVDNIHPELEDEHGNTATATTDK